MTAALLVASARPYAFGQAVPPSTSTSTSTPSTSTTTSTSTTVTTSSSSTSSVPATSSSLVGPPAPAGPPAPEAPSGDSGSKPGEPPPPSVSDEVVADFLDSLERTPANSSRALLEALRPLQDYGISPQEAAIRFMGRFPLAGEAYFRDDFGEYRAGPPVHGHQGTDIWAAFDVPVRSPADGVVRYEDSGLGGKGAFVTEADGTYYYLAHLNSFAPDLASGAQVKVGQVIGFNGDSGNARGGPPHVHFEVHPGGGAAVNPKPILDRWLEEALAAVPALLVPYRPATPGSRALAAVGLARHLDRGVLTGPDQGGAAPREADDEPEPVVVQPPPPVPGALASPLTPPALRNEAPPPG